MKFIAGYPILCLVSLLLFGCQTTVEIAGNEHRTVVEKWQELARYAESKLVQYPMTITAELAISDKAGEARYVLKNIQLSASENSYNVNLVQPSFTHKYICHPVCNQLLEFIPIEENKGATILSLYFNHHEFELFEFYGHLYRLNDAIGLLDVIDAGHVEEYLGTIVQEQIRVNDLREFMLYLSDRLSAGAYENFLNNSDVAGKPRHQLAGAGSARDFSQTMPSESDHWNLNVGKNNKAPESDLWVAHAGEEAKRWSPILSVTNYTPTIDWTPGSLEKEAWRRARKLPFTLEDYVCSYKQNSFGWVTRVSDTDVTVELMGQAKVVRDGMISDVEDGFLFSDSKSISFIPIKGKKTFKLNEVAACYPQ